MTALVCAALLAGVSTQSAAPPFGNVFLLGDAVRIEVPREAADLAQTWRVLDDALTAVAFGEIRHAAVIDGGRLPAGWYRVEFLDTQNRRVGFTTAAVLHNAPQTASGASPVAVDIALSWLARDEPATWPGLARLAALAGTGWVRDRIHWREMQAGTGEFFEQTHYDAAASVQSGAGLEILQVFHTVPSWAREPVADNQRPRTDLRHLYRFCEGMARRFEGRVDAWEPWNEGNAANFGGLAMDELCSLQKAAYCGFKRGDPDLPVCWAPLGGANTPAQAEAVLRNETWPYYDVYSIHSYDWPHAYAQLWEPARRAACGRPVWVTECDRGMNADPASPADDFTHDAARLKAQFMAQSYACSLFAGASRHFHFILGPYTEGHGAIQFGLLRHDYTPRMSYVALAAVGRFLADARCLGRWEVSENPEVHLYAFRALPDGAPRDVLVAWVEKEVDWPARGKQSLPWPLHGDLRVEAAFDYLGRPIKPVPPAEITSAPVFVVLPEGETEALPLKTMPASEYRGGSPSPVVLQFDTPGIAPVMRQRAWTPEPERVFEPGTEISCELIAYNFAETEVSGAISATEIPKEMVIEPETWHVTLPAGERTVLAARMSVPAPHAPSDADWVVFQGEFGNAGRPVLAFQINRPE